MLPKVSRFMYVGTEQEPIFVGIETLEGKFLSLSDLVAAINDTRVDDDPGLISELNRSVGESYRARLYSPELVKDAVALLDAIESLLNRSLTVRAIRSARIVRKLN